jgi:hypothetical protein
MVKRMGKGSKGEGLSTGTAAKGGGEWGGVRGAVGALGPCSHLSLVPSLSFSSFFFVNNID